MLSRLLCEAQRKAVVKHCGSAKNVPHPDFRISVYRSLKSIQHELLEQINKFYFTSETNEALMIKHRDHCLCQRLEKNRLIKLIGRQCERIVDEEARVRISGRIEEDVKIQATLGGPSS